MRRNVAESEESDKKKAEREKEFKKNFEATRQKRTDVSNYLKYILKIFNLIIKSWNTFQGKGTKEKKKKKMKGFFKPPKNKIEKR